MAETGVDSVLTGSTEELAVADNNADAWEELAFNSTDVKTATDEVDITPADVVASNSVGTADGNKVVGATIVVVVGATNVVVVGATIVAVGVPVDTTQYEQKKLQKLIPYETPLKQY